MKFIRIKNFQRRLKLISKLGSNNGNKVITKSKQLSTILEKYPIESLLTEKKKERESELVRTYKETVTR